MRRALLIFLSLILVLVGWSTVCAEDGFYVIPAMRGNYAPVPKTGQTTPYVAGDDGTLKMGVAWPALRFTDNSNGTVTDKLTGLIWMKDGGVLGAQTWADAMTTANTLESGLAGLTDGSQAGDWRLPNVRELLSLIDYGRFNPAFPASQPFTDVQPFYFWSSTTSATGAGGAWGVYFFDGAVISNGKSATGYVWCVRGGK
jgi:hypothetical protein